MFTELLFGVKIMIKNNEKAIQEAAYYIWQNAGCPQGQDEYFWAMAVEQINNNNKSCNSLKKCSNSKSSSCKSSASKKTSTAKKTSSSAKSSSAKKSSK